MNNVLPPRSANATKRLRSAVGRGGAHATQHGQTPPRILKSIQSRRQIFCRRLLARKIPIRLGGESIDQEVDEGQHGWREVAGMGIDSSDR